jgi:chromosome segregation ATPase
LWAAYSDLAKNTQDLKKSNREQKQEIAGLREAISRISEESQAMREELAGLRLQQDEMSAELARFTEDEAKIGQEQAKSDGEIARLRECLANHERAHEVLRRQLAEANSARAREAARLRQHQEKSVQDLATLREERTGT